MVLLAARWQHVTVSVRPLLLATRRDVPSYDTVTSLECLVSVCFMSTAVYSQSAGLPNVDQRHVNCRLYQGKLVNI